MALIIPAGSNTMMKVSTAPPGWVKTNTFNLNVMRVVTGAAGSGGSIAYTSVFVQNTTSVASAGGSSGATTLTTSQVASHTHDAFTATASTRVSTTPPLGVSLVVNTVTPNFPSAANGASASHSHTITLGSTSISPSNSFDLRVKYVDCIIVQRQ